MTLQNTKMVVSFVLADLMLTAAMSANSSASAQQSATQSDAAALVQGSSRLNAQQIYRTDSITADSDVKTLVITIPDNAGTGESAWRGFLPSNATVASGTTLVVLNADVNATHTITVLGPESGRSAAKVPYMNIMANRLDDP